MRRLTFALGVLVASSLGIVQGIQRGPATSAHASAGRWPPPVHATPEKAPALSAEDELKTIVFAPGYHVELVAKEPLVKDPIWIDFDADGRMWVLEMPGFMPDTPGKDSREPINDIAVLEDTNGDGVMDKRTVFAEHLMLPRAIKVLDRGAVLIGEPPNLWLMKDADGNPEVDTKDLVSNTFGRAEGNIEHNANSLLWAMDNTIYTSEHDWHLRWNNGTFDTVPTLSRGQWGASQDDAGRVFRNVNDSPLFIDYVAAKYYVRNPNLVRTRGFYDSVITREESVIWPVRATRGVNRGYRDQFFRPDGSIVTIQGSGTPVIFRGDKLPTEVQGQAFITDSPTNLVHAYRIVDDGTGRLRAEDFYKKGEFFASWDERCRPVNLASGPDGTLYVVDMYRGVVQDGAFWTDYLRDYIKSRELELPVHLGRIWRVVHDGMKPDAAPKLSSASAAELVRTLSHPNGWRRDTAQQLLIQRGDKSVVGQLRQLAGDAPDWRARLHALWTLDGLRSLHKADAQRALADKSPYVRASAIRLSEHWMAGDEALSTAVLKLMDDVNVPVRYQLAATIGELPRAARVQQATTMLERFGNDPIVVDATLSGLKESEQDVLGRLLQGTAPQPQTGDAVKMLAGAIARSADATSVQQVIAEATDGTVSGWRRVALLEGLDAGLQTPGGGRGGRGGFGGRGRGAALARQVTLASEPSGLTKLAASSDEAGTLAKSIVSKIDWPGKPAPRNEAPPLTPEQQQRFAQGAELYKNICMGCHQADGRGQERLAPSLVDSRYVNAADAGATIRVLLAGKEGKIGLMPPLGFTLTDDQIAAVLTYIRREWGHTASPVAPEDVREIRGLTKMRTRPWTDDELTLGRGGRGGV